MEIGETYCLRKTELDLKLLRKCNNNNVVPKFLSFRVANNNLKNSSTYKQCQSNLLREEICKKKSLARIQSVLCFLESMTGFSNRKV